MCKKDTVIAPNTAVFASNTTVFALNLRAKYKKLSASMVILWTPSPSLLNFRAVNKNYKEKTKGSYFWF